MKIQNLIIKKSIGSNNFIIEQFHNPKKSNYRQLKLIFYNITIPDRLPIYYLEPKETLTVSLSSFIGQKMISIRNVIQNLQAKLAPDSAVAQLRFIVMKITREFENIYIWVKNLRCKNLIFNRFLIDVYHENGHLTTSSCDPYMYVMLFFAAKPKPKAVSTKLHKPTGKCLSFSIFVSL